jgi:hypothetical protein
LTRTSVAAVTDSHSFFEIDGNTLTSQSIGPSFGADAVSYDYSNGYPQTMFLPLR